MLSFHKNQSDNHYTNLTIEDTLVVGKSITVGTLNYGRLNPPVVGSGTVAGAFVVDPSNPDAFPTIQDGVDAAIEDGASYPDNQKVVLIAEGVYNEDVVIPNSGIHLKGIGPEGSCGISITTIPSIDIQAAPGVELVGSIVIDAPFVAISRLTVMPTSGTCVFYTSNASTGTGWILDSCIQPPNGGVGVDMNSPSGGIFIINNTSLQNDISLVSPVFNCVEVGSNNALSFQNSSCQATGGGFALLSTSTFVTGGTNSFFGGLVRTGTLPAPNFNTFNKCVFGGPGTAAPAAQLQIPVGGRVELVNCNVEAVGGSTVWVDDGAGGTGGELMAHNLSFNEQNIGTIIPTANCSKVTTNRTGPLTNNVVPVDAMTLPTTNITPFESGHTYTLDTASGALGITLPSSATPGDILPGTWFHFVRLDGTDDVVFTVGTGSIIGQSFDQTGTTPPAQLSAATVRWTGLAGSGTAGTDNANLGVSFFYDGFNWRAKDILRGEWI